PPNHLHPPSFPTRRSSDLSPDSIYNIVHESLKFRKMAHSAEDITTQILTDEFNIAEEEYFSSDIRNGFVLKFPQKPVIDLKRLEDRKSTRLNSSHVKISYA